MIVALSHQLVLDTPPYLGKRVHFIFGAGYHLALRPRLGDDWHAAQRPRGRGL